MPFLIFVPCPPTTVIIGRWVKSGEPKICSYPEIDIGFSGVLILTKNCIKIWPIRDDIGAVVPSELACSAEKNGPRKSRNRPLIDIDFVGESCRQSKNQGKA